MAEHPETLPSCADKYEYLHETACCYRADIISCETDGTYTVEWTETVPPVGEGSEEAQVAGVKTSYGCGWCLTPFLVGHEIKPFCPGSHVLVLDNQAAMDRYLIIGFDAKYYTDPASMLKPCIPDNLGFYFSESRYGVPYFTEETTDGQTECSPVNPWEEGLITIPRGTENNIGSIITIATEPGEITAIKPFQVPGFDLLSSISDTMSHGNVFMNLPSPEYLSVDSHVTIDESNVLTIDINEKTKCIISGVTLNETTFSQSVGSFPATPYLSTGPENTSVPLRIYPLVSIFPTQNFFPSSKNSIYKYICRLVNPPKEFTITKGTNGIFTLTELSLSDGFVSTKEENIIGDPNSLHDVFGNGEDSTYTINYGITGTCLLATNGDSFNVSKTVEYMGKNISGVVDEITGEGPSFSGVGKITWNSEVSSEVSVSYSMGPLSWINTSSSSTITSIFVDNPYSGQICSGSGSSLGSEEWTTPILFNEKSKIALVLRTVVTIESDFDPSVYTVVVWWPGGYIWTNYAETAWLNANVTTDLYLELLTPLGVITLEHNSLNYKYVGVFIPANISSADPKTVPFLYDAPHLTHTQLLNSFGYATDATSYYNLGMNMWFINLTNAFLNVAMDNRQVKVTYNKNGVTKNRIFVDNVEIFLKEDPDNWTSTDILNR